MAEDLTRSADSFVFKADRPWPNRRLKVAAIIGHATPDSVRLWVRTGQPGSFSVWVYRRTSEEAEQALREFLSATPLAVSDFDSFAAVTQQKDFEIDDYTADTTRVLDIQDLSPDTRYGYLLYDRESERAMLGHNRLRSFRTPPPNDEKRTFQFGLFSCNLPYAVNGLFKKRTDVSNIDMWDFLSTTLKRHQDDVDLVIAGGDQCYSDGVDTLNIWQHLNRRMRKSDGELLPDEEAMRSWFRDVYRGYWGFEGVQRVFDSFPTYMIWDDHEIVDGWGSHYFDEGVTHDGLGRMLPDLEARGLDYEDGTELVRRMFRAARNTYAEYQHSHNPRTAEGQFDYAFRRGGCGFYVLDGRGHRDLARNDYRILGRTQFDRFADWLRAQDPEETPFVFVVSAVPVLHTRAALTSMDELLGGLGDDLRDSWEHELHTVEREALMARLFEAAARGVRVSILSGDVHISAVYVIEDGRGNRIHQLTSSAITCGLSLPQSWVLRMGAADRGTTPEGYEFERLAIYTRNSFAMVSVDPTSGQSWFKLYGEQQLPSAEPAEKAVPLSHSLAKIRLF